MMYIIEKLIRDEEMAANLRVEENDISEDDVTETDIDEWNKNQG